MEGPRDFACLVKKFEETNIGYQSKLTGVSLPTGGSMMIFNSSRSMYNVLHNYLDFFAEESCGQCTPCRVGNATAAKRYRGHKTWRSAFVVSR